jgi:hypothetical protein
MDAASMSYERSPDRVKRPPGRYQKVTAAYRDHCVTTGTAAPGPALHDQNRPGSIELERHDCRYPLTK